MRRVLLALLLLGTLVSSPSPVVAQSGGCSGQTRMGVPFATEQLTVGATAVTLTLATFKPGTDARNWARYAVFSTETNTLRFLVTGATPTASVGHLVPAGAFVTVCGLTALTNFKAIRVTADVPTQVTYFK